MIAIRILPLCAALLTTLAGCGTTPPATYYLLNPGAVTQDRADSTATLQLELGPVSFPPYLDRNKLIVVTGENTLRMAEFHRWAEPLEANFVRVLAQDLAEQLPQAQIHKHPWRAAGVRPAQIHIEVLRFDTDDEQQAHLELRWQLTDRENGILVPLRTDEYRLPVTGKDYAARVQAMSRCLTAFSQDLAQAIRTTMPNQ